MISLSVSLSLSLSLCLCLFVTLSPFSGHVCVRAHLYVCMYVCVRARVCVALFLLFYLNHAPGKISMNETGASVSKNSMHLFTF